MDDLLLNALESPVSSTSRGCRPQGTRGSRVIEVVINAHREVLSIESQRSRYRLTRFSDCTRIGFDGRWQRPKRIQSLKVRRSARRFAIVCRDAPLNAPSTSHNVREASTTRNSNYRWRRRHRNRLIPSRPTLASHVVDLRFKKSTRRTTKRRICSHACLGCSTGNGKIRRHRSIVSGLRSRRAIWTPLKRKSIDSGKHRGAGRRAKRMRAIGTCRS